MGKHRLPEFTDDHDGHTINIGVPDRIGPDTDAYDHAKMAERIGRWMPPVGGASVGTLSTTVEVDHRTMSRILAAAEVNGPEVDRLRERNLTYARDLAALRAERDAWKALAEGRASMLAFYRVGKQPSEAAWRKVDAARQALAALEATDG